MKLALSLVLLAFSFGAFAADQEGKTWDLNLIKLACKDPGAVHNQMPPTDLKITCRLSICEWVPGPSTYGEMPGWGKIAGSLMTNKPGIHVPRSTWAIPRPPMPYSCPTFEEQMSETEMVFGVTCDEVMAMTSIRDFCAARMETEVQANEEILTVTKTGKKQSMCGGAVTQK